MNQVGENEKQVLEIEEEPGGRSPAPGRLRLVQQFVNTNDREAGHDLLNSPQTLASWFQHWTVWPRSSEPTKKELDLALDIREGIRDLAGAATMQEELRAAVYSLNIRVEVRQAKFQLDSPSTLGKALSPIIDAARAAMDDATWDRLKICDRDRCRWMYYDSSRNASAKWCATSICGSREKARRAYQRKTNSS